MTAWSLQWRKKANKALGTFPSDALLGLYNSHFISCLQMGFQVNETYYQWKLDWHHFRALKKFIFALTVHMFNTDKQDSSTTSSHDTTTTMFHTWCLPFLIHSLYTTVLIHLVWLSLISSLAMTCFTWTDFFCVLRETTPDVTTTSRIFLTNHK